MQYMNKTSDIRVSFYTFVPPFLCGDRQAFKCTGDWHEQLTTL